MAKDVAKSKEVTKPFRRLDGFSQGGFQVDYNDLVKRNVAGEDAAETLATGSTNVFYTTYSFPTTTKGDLLAHDGSTQVRKAIGSNYQVLSADSSTSDGITWRSLTTTKGDLFGFDTVPNRVAVGADGQALVADSTATPGLRWMWGSSLGLQFCGSESDGDVTLVANATLASGYSIIFYGDLGLGTYTLTQNTASAHYVMAIFARTITSDGGSIFRSNVSGMPNIAGGLGGVGSAGGGSGGAGGVGGAALFVQAITISGTGTIYADGGNAANGSNATVASGSGTGAAGNASPGATQRRWGSTTNRTTGGNSNAAGGIAAGTAVLGEGNGGSWDQEVRDLFRQPEYYFTVGTDNSYTLATAHWCHLAGGGGGGGAGGRNNGGAQGASGGGGGGTWANMYSDGAFGLDGGAGGAGGAGGSGAGGGGGGSGGSGGFVVVKCMTLASGWTVRAKGGNGANGGDGNAYGGGGGAGAGGPGGNVVLFTAYGTSATIDVSGGSSGSPGAAGASGGSAGGTVSASQSGISMSLSMVGVS